MKRRLLIGVIITDCHVDFQVEILRGIISQAFKGNCDIAVIAPLHNFSIESVHRDEEKRIFDLILSDNIDGFIYDRHTFVNEKIREYIDELCRRTGKPVMLLDYNGHKNFETTSVDDCTAFETITDHLIDTHGKKKIYCLTGPKNTYNSEERLRGYMFSMKKHGLHFDKGYCFYGDYWHNAAETLAQNIADGAVERPEAVVCGNDIMAIYLTKKLMANGIRVPEDIAVTGYDASDDGYHSSPSITSYSRPNFQLGAEAFRRLYRIITGRICRRVPNENGSLRLGRSCGCPENIQLRNNVKRLKKINQNLDGNLLYGDMLFDITNTLSIPDFAERLDNYTYFIYNMRRIRICLTKQYIDAASGEVPKNLSFRSGDLMKVVLSKSAVQRENEDDGYFSSKIMLPDYEAERDYPSAYYITPLHYNDNFFGYAAVSFGKEPISFNSLYPKWINYVNVALEQLMIKSLMSKTIASTSKALNYDSVTGLPNRSGLEIEFRDRLPVKVSAERTADCISIELQNFKKLYYQNGEEKCRSILRAFADNLRSCLKNGDLLGIWGTQTFCIISFEPGRAETIYTELCAKNKETQFSGGENCNIDFSLGVQSFTFDSSADLADVMYKSTVNKLFNYNTSESNVNPQFEKLCLLRSRIMKNPELPWNIGEIAESLYLSKSYLQKIYKSYFNKSIIEEMIEFRINNAKNLLETTDKTVTDISRECGYSSYNYFVRQFRAYSGTSPSEYRESVRKGRPEE